MSKTRASCFTTDSKHVETDECRFCFPVLGSRDEALAFFFDINLNIYFKWIWRRIQTTHSKIRAIVWSTWSWIFVFYFVQNTFLKDGKPFFLVSFWRLCGSLLHCKFETFLVGDQIVRSELRPNLGKLFTGKTSLFCEWIRAHFHFAIVNAPRNLLWHQFFTKAKRKVWVWSFPAPRFLFSVPLSRYPLPVPAPRSPLPVLRFSNIQFRTRQPHGRIPPIAFRLRCRLYHPNQKILICDDRSILMCLMVRTT